MANMTSVVDEMKTLRSVLKAYCSIPHKNLYQSSFMEFMSKLDALPDEEKTINKIYIDDIKTAGLRFKNDDKLYFSKNDTKLFNLTVHRVLKNLNPNKKDPGYQAPTEIKKEHSKSSSGNKEHFVLPRKSTLLPKLVGHPIINELLLHLMDQLNGATMDSYLNGIVQEYYDIVGSVRQDVVECFDTFEEIDKCLTKHGWEKNNFICAPDRKSLRYELSSILNRMSM